MKHPLIQLMPLKLDIKIKQLLLAAWWHKQSNKLLISSAVLVVPALAILLYVVLPTQPTANEETIVQAVRAAQQAELARSSEGIYHMTRVITEGADKPAFVTEQTGREVVAPMRVDVLQTWQHNDTALAIVESNTTAQPIEVYLSREHNGTLALHHYAEGQQVVPENRDIYDQAHDLASLYTAYMSLERPSIPVLAEGAQIISVSEDGTSARFETVVAEGLRIESLVDLSTNHITEEVIYVVNDSGEDFEMTRITYIARELLPADEFEEIFDPTRYAYETIATS
jgi:hypothetical protein